MKPLRRLCAKTSRHRSLQHQPIAFIKARNITLVSPSSAFSTATVPLAEQKHEWQCSRCGVICFSSECFSCGLMRSEFIRHSETADVDDKSSITLLGDFRKQTFKNSLLMDPVSFSNARFSDSLKPTTPSSNTPSPAYSPSSTSTISNSFVSNESISSEKFGTTMDMKTPSLLPTQVATSELIPSKPNQKAKLEDIATKLRDHILSCGGEMHAGKLVEFFKTIPEYESFAGPGKKLVKRLTLCYPDIVRNENNFLYAVGKSPATSDMPGKEAKESKSKSGFPCETVTPTATALTVTRTDRNQLAKQLHQLVIRNDITNLESNNKATATCKISHIKNFFRTKQDSSDATSCFQFIDNLVSEYPHLFLALDKKKNVFTVYRYPVDPNAKSKMISGSNISHEMEKMHFMQAEAAAHLLRAFIIAEAEAEAKAEAGAEMVDKERGGEEEEIIMGINETHNGNSTSTSDSMRLVQISQDSDVSGSTIIDEVDKSINTVDVDDGDGDGGSISKKKELFKKVNMNLLSKFDEKHPEAKRAIKKLGGLKVCCESFPHLLKWSQHEVTTPIDVPPHLSPTPLLSNNISKQNKGSDETEDDVGNCLTSSETSTSTALALFEKHQAAMTMIKYFKENGGVVSDMRNFIKYYPNKSDYPKMIAIDCEGTHCVPPLLVQVSPIGSNRVFIEQPSSKEGYSPILKALLEDDDILKVFFDAKGDLQSMKIERSKINHEDVQKTMKTYLSTTMVDEPSGTVSISNRRMISLNEAARILFGQPGEVWRKEKNFQRGFGFMNRMSTISRDMTLYAASDAWFTMKIWDELRSNLNGMATKNIMKPNKATKNMIGGKVVKAKKSLRQQRVGTKVTKSSPNNASSSSNEQDLKRGKEESSVGEENGKGDKKEEIVEKDEAGNVSVLTSGSSDKEVVISIPPIM